MGRLWWDLTLSYDFHIKEKQSLYCALSYLVRRDTSPVGYGLFSLSWTSLRRPSTVDIWHLWHFLILLTVIIIETLYLLKPESLEGTPDISSFRFLRIRVHFWQNVCVRGQGSLRGFVGQENKNHWGTPKWSPFLVRRVNSGTISVISLTNVEVRNRRKSCPGRGRM